MECPHCHSEAASYKVDGERRIIGWEHRGVLKGSAVYKCEACQGGILLGRWGRVRAIRDDSWLEMEDARRRLEHREQQDTARAAKRARKQGN